jgi:Ca-activated chloride channel family protein
VEELDFLQAYGGTAIGDALAAAVELGKKTVRGDDGRQTIAYTVAAKNPLVTILFLSDGKQTRGALQPLQGAERARAAGIPVYTVSLGTPNGVLTRQFGGFGGQGQPPRIPVPPDPATLKSIASLTGGKFFRAGSADALQSAYKELGSRLGRVPGDKEITNEAVGLAALLLIAAGVLSALWAPRLP